MAEQLGLQVHPVVDLEPRHHQGVPWTERSVAEEGDAAVVLPHEARGQLPVDDAREDAGHTPILTAAGPGSRLRGVRYTGGCCRAFLASACRCALRVDGALGFLACFLGAPRGFSPAMSRESTGAVARWRTAVAAARAARPLRRWTQS